MSTGQSFELEIEQSLARELQRGALAIDPAHAKVYRHKGYYSSLRDKAITVDVSLELCRPGTSEPYLIWIWECKNYAKPVPVGDVEEFHAKLEQLGVHRIKGTIACRNGFQDGAIRTARGWGIGLVRLLPSGSIIRLEGAKRTVSKGFVVFGLTQRDSRQLEATFYALSCDGTPAMGMDELFEMELRQVGSSQ